MGNRTGRIRIKRKKSMVIDTICILLSITLLITMVTILIDRAKASKLEDNKIASSEEEQELQSAILIPSQNMDEKQERIEIDNQDVPINKEGQADHETDLEQQSIIEVEELTNESIPSTKLDEAQQKEDSIEPSKKVVYLTFDDGPSSSSMELLEILREYDMKATFFMLAPYVKQYPDAARLMVFDGHAVALHGVTHDKNKFYGTPQSPLNEMLENQKIIEAVTGVKTFLIRTPYGSMPYLTSDQRSILKQNGFKLWDWNVDSEDWRFRDHRYVASVIQQLERREMEPSSVILMHENETTVKHIRPLLNYLVEKGYETRILTEDLESFHYGNY